ncbi:serine/threonine-protein kinase [Actinacidiphila alni]|uniref:serine/threonine-protein kinase n=1 Tax=Actinacidiphila alni TaxID=380248 RepID=UPI0034538F17
MSRREDIDFSRSRAILLGTSEYTVGFADRRAMPAARNSLAEVRKVLTGPCDWPAKRVEKLHNVRDSGKVLRSVTALVKDVEDVLLFYYVGHGLPLPENGRYDLGLALSDTDDDPAHRALTSLRLRDLREVLTQNSRARIRVLILDCCSSGIATKYGGPNSNHTAFADSATPVRGAGTYIWTACGHSQETYFEDGEAGLTHFAKSLSAAVREAREEFTPGATVAHLHDEVRRRLRDVPGLPVPPRPDLHYSGRPDQFVFVRGRAPLLPDRPFTFAPLDDTDPRRVGPYDIVAKLGAGGVGKVYLSFTATRQAVAVKVLRPDLSQDPEFASRFGREIDLARRVRSSHAARVLDADANATEPWMASSYVCGPSLHELVRDNGPLPTRDVLLITAGIARALEAVQAAGAVHRDLKPANVMLDDTGPKVIDFGIAKSVAATLMTRTNVRLGTPAYKSPEQALGRREVTTASDVFTLGATVYYLATGRDAFEAEDPLGLINLIAHEEPDLDALDDEVRGVVVRCLAKDPADRPTPTEVVQLCADVTGPVAHSAYPYIAGAGPAINARAAALRALAPPPVVPPPVVVRAPGGPGRPTPPSEPATGLAAEPASGAQRIYTARQLRTAGAAVALVMLIVLAAVLLPKQLHSGNATASGTGPTTGFSLTPLDTGTTDDGEDDLATTPEDDPSDSPSDEPTTTEPETTTAPAPDVFRDAAPGDCLANDGTFARDDLRPAACGNRVFQVLKVLHGTTDAHECDGLTNDDYNVPSGADDLVLCLTYRSTDTYHARPGTCLYAPDGTDGTWYRQTCGTGNMQVRARLVGTTDKNRCKAYSDVDATLGSGTDWDELDVMLCLSVNFPDAAARAPVGHCLLRTGTGQAHFDNVASCDQGNVIVTARSRRYHDTAICPAGNGWTSWPSTAFPEYAYTVCFRNL